MLDMPQEARLNLVIYYLRNREITEAFNLIKDLEPSTPPEYILKGVVHTCYGQLTDHSEHLKIAQQYFQLVRPPVELTSKWFKLGGKFRGWQVVFLYCLCPKTYLFFEERTVRGSC